MYLNIGITFLENAETKTNPAVERTCAKSRADRSLSRYAFSALRKREQAWSRHCSRKTQRRFGAGYFEQHIQTGWTQVRCYALRNRY